MKRVATRGLLYVTATFFALFAALPFAWMIFTVFKQNSDLYDPNRNPFLYNDPPTLGNITFLFERTEYATFVRNTLIVAVLVVLITLIGAVPAAYSLSRLAGKWGEGLGIAIFLVYLVPPTLLFIPLSRVVADLGLRNTWWAMVLVYPTFTIPFCTWLLMGFFKSIPRDIEEQAMVDGYSRLGAIWRTVLPVSLPGLLTVVVFSFALTMHEFVYALGLCDLISAEDDLDRGDHGADSGRRLLLAITNGRRGYRRYPHRTPLQPLPRPLHRWLHTGGGEGIASHRILEASPDLPRARAWS